MRLCEPNRSGFAAQLQGGLAPAERVALLSSVQYNVGMNSEDIREMVAGYREALRDLNHYVGSAERLNRTEIILQLDRIRTQMLEDQFRVEDEC